MSDSLFLESQLAQTRIALHQVADDKGHLHHELPVGILLLACLLTLRTVLVPSFLHLAIFLRPSHGLLIFLLVINALVHTAENLRLVHTLVAHTQIFLEEFLVHDTPRDSHALASDGQVTLSAHLRHGHRRPRPTENLLGHIRRDGIVIHVLHIVSVNAKSRQSLLRMAGQHRRKIDSPRTFRPVEAPYSLGPIRIHIHGLRTVTPT